jgi:uncharacterized RDD family membrane protein YckC
MATDDRYTLETPEHIEVEFDLAGIGSRFCAMLIDTLLLALIIAVIGILTCILDIGLIASLEQFDEEAFNWFNALVVAIVGILFFGGYYIFCELLMRGQTPGKRGMRIRVIRDDGTAVTANEVLIRNIVRIVDFLPASYALGGLVMFFHPMSKRLGDVAAGTIVIKEGRLDYRAQADKNYQLAPAPTQVANAELTPEERRVVSGFLHRRSELLVDARRQFAERLARPLYEKYGGHYGGGAEEYLERLIDGRHHAS